MIRSADAVVGRPLNAFCAGVDITGEQGHSTGMEAVPNPSLLVCNGEGNHGGCITHDKRGYPPRSSLSALGAGTYWHQTGRKGQIGSTLSITHRTHSGQETLERRIANEWELALFSFLAHSGPIGRAANSPVSYIRGSGPSNASIENTGQGEIAMESSSSSVDLTMPVENSSIGSSSTSVRNEENVTAFSTDNVSSRPALATGTENLNVQSPPLSTHVSRVENSSMHSRDISQIVRPILPVSGAIIRTTADSDTGRRLLAVDLHIFKLLDAQERHIRACNEVLGRAPEMLSFEWQH